MSLSVGAYKVGGAGQCSNMRKRYPWQPCERPPPNQKLLVLQKGGASEQGWNGTDSNNPKHQAEAVASNRQHTYQRKAADNESNTKNHRAGPRQFGTYLDGKVDRAVDNKWQGHVISSQLTRDACKSFGRCADIKLVSIASPTSKSLN